VTANETRTTVENVTEGQTVRLTGGALFTVSHVRREAGYTYLYEIFSDAAPYALPDGSTAYVVDVPAANLLDDDAESCASCGATDTELTSRSGDIVCVDADSCVDRSNAQFTAQEQRAIIDAQHSATTIAGITDEQIRHATYAAALRVLVDRDTEHGTDLRTVFADAYRDESARISAARAAAAADRITFTLHAAGAAKIAAHTGETVEQVNAAAARAGWRVDHPATHPAN
jgi:hypothetical protein